MQFQVSTLVAFFVLLAATSAAEGCDCNVDDSTSLTFKCGNEIYVCPGVERVCSVQESQNSDYFAITQVQCDAMKAVEIGEKCVKLEHHGNKNPKALSNRVCYSGDDNTSDGFHGMKEDGSCGVCNNSIPPPIVVETIEPTEPEVETTAPTTTPTTTPTKPAEDIIELIAPIIVDPNIQITDTPTTAPFKICPEDIALVKQNGATEFPIENAGIQIISQDTSTVTVALSQEWTAAPVGQEQPNTLDSIYYNYKDTLWESKCYEEDNVTGGGATYDTITITCNLLTPIGYLEICVADDVSNGILSAQDSANIPKCCHSTVPPETPVVCYSFEIRCDSECVDPDTTTATRKLRGSMSK